MMTAEDDVMVHESLLPYPKDVDRSVLGARAREMQEVGLENGVFEITVVDSPASGAKEVTEQVVGMETSPPALTHSPGGDDMSKHGAGVQTESPQEQELALPTKPSRGGRVIELPFECSSFSSPNSGNFNDNAVEGTGVPQKKRRKRGNKWAEEETDGLLRAVSNTPKVSTRMDKGTESDPYWEAVAKAVPGRMAYECQGRMDTLKRSFSTMNKYCDDEGKEFNELNEEDFSKMKVSHRLTEASYNHIRDHCPPKTKKKSKKDGAGSSSKTTGFVPDTSTSGLLRPILGEPAMVASGPVMQPMEDPPACQLAGPLHEQAPPVPQNADVAEDFIGGLFANYDLQSCPPWE